MACGTSQNNRWYHGTSGRNARKLLTQPFRDWCIPSQTPNLKHLRDEYPNRYFHRGPFGKGIYITKDCEVAASFGPVVFELEIQKGTKIVDLGKPPEKSILDSLKREFGKEILTKPFWIVLPKNKSLTLSETLNLARYFNFKRSQADRFSKEYDSFDKLFYSIRNALIRFGIGGWGEEKTKEGIVIFASDRIKIKRIASIISYKFQDRWRDSQSLEIQKNAI